MIERIHKITEEQVQKLLYYGLVVLMFVLPIPQFFMSIYNMKANMIQTTILRAFLVYFTFLFVVELANKRFSFQKNRLVLLCLIGLATTGFTSVLVADDWLLALYGFGKGEGYFSLLAYYMIFLSSIMLKEKRYIYTLLKLFLLFGCLIALVGIIQFTGIYQFRFWYPGMAYVPMLNPNFYGAFAVLFTGVVIGGFFIYHKESELTHPFTWWNRGVWYSLVLLGYAACISAASSLVYVGLIMIFLLYAFLEFVTKRKEFLTLVALIIGLFIMIFLFNIICKGRVVGEISTVGKQIQEEGTIFGDGVGSSRMLIWKQTIALLPEYGWVGCGLEQLDMFCMENYGGENAVQFDKAHNEYLNLWITEGILALIFYLIFLFSLFISGIKQFLRKREIETKNKSMERNVISKMVFFAFFGYIAQAFFNISVIQVAPYFWMICGLLYYGKRSLNEETMDS